MLGKGYGSLLTIVVGFIILAVGCADSPKKSETQTTPNTSRFTSGNNTPPAPTPAPTEPVGSDSDDGAVDDDSLGDDDLDDPIFDDDSDSVVDDDVIQDADQDADGKVSNEESLKALSERVDGQFNDLNNRLGQAEEMAMKGFKDIKKDTEEDTWDKISKYGVPIFLGVTALGWVRDGFEKFNAASSLGKPMAALWESKDSLLAQQNRKKMTDEINRGTAEAVNATQKSAAITQGKVDQTTNQVFQARQEVQAGFEGVSNQLQGLFDSHNRIANAIATLESARRNHVNAMSKELLTQIAGLQAMLANLNEQRSHIERGSNDEVAIARYQAAINNIRSKVQTIASNPALTEKLAQCAPDVLDQLRQLSGFVAGISSM